MKRWILILLCLSLAFALGLPVLAEETGAQPPAQTEAPQGTEPPAPTPPPSGTEGPAQTNPPSGTEGPVQTNPPAATEAPGHTHTWVSVTVPSTCTEEGGTVVMCSVCEAVDSVVLAPLAAHTYSNSCDPDCNVCGQSREVTHTLSTGWKYNSSSHWHVCTVCGAKGAVGGHFPGPAATEDRDQFCLTCGLLMTKRLSHTHKYKTQWEFDSTGHWYPCEGCQEKKDFAQHSYDDPCDPDCNVCGYTAATSHSFEDSWQWDEAGHWQLCGLCGETTPPEAHDSGADVCGVCGWGEGATQAHVHELPGTWQKDEDSHWQECACGEVLQKEAHTWEEDQEVCPVCAMARTLEPEPEAAEFPWGLLLAALAALLLLAVGALVFLLRRKE